MSSHASMNRIYRLVFNAATGMYVAVAETAKGRGKAGRSASAAMLAALTAMGGLSTAGAQNVLPTGGVVASGSAAITQTSSAMTINQSSNSAILNWQSFSVGAANSVRFNQPSASAVALNRVIGNSASEILGSISANGKVMLVNQNGILMGSGAQVDTGGFIGSTLNIKDSDFLAGRYIFDIANNTNGTAGSIINNGRINTPSGYAVLIAPQVTNNGFIAARAGTVAIGAGNKVSLDMVGDGLISLKVDQAAFNAAIVNTGSIEANGGTVLLKASSANALFDTVINSTGIIRADSIANVNGRIILDGGSTGITEVTGEITARGLNTGEMGGSISVLGDKVGLLGSGKLDASGDAGGGTVLVGGNWQGSGSERRASRTIVASNANIDVSATNNGNGGTVVVWSDGRTDMDGSIKATGGINGGNGGNVETSGKVALDLKGRVDVTAANGQGGQWLLDPTDIRITAANANLASAGPTYQDNGGGVTATVDAGALGTALTGGTTVNVQTSNAGAGLGTITVQDSITASGAGTLNLIANGGIQINAAIASDGINALNVGLYAGSNGTPATIATAGAQFGYVATRAAGSITTTGGKVIMVTGTDSNISLQGSITTGGGDVSLKAVGSSQISILNALNAGTGNVQLQLTGSGGSIAEALAGVITAANLNLTNTRTTTTLTNAANNIASLSGSTGTLSLTNNGALALGALTIAGPLTLNSGGTVSQTGALTQTRGTVNVTATAGTVKLTNTANDVSGPVNLSAAAGGVAFVNNNAAGIQAGNITAATSMNTTNAASIANFTASDAALKGVVLLQALQGNIERSGATKIVADRAVLVAANRIGGATATDATLGVRVEGAAGASAREVYVSAGATQMASVFGPTAVPTFSKSLMNGATALPSPASVAYNGVVLNLDPVPAPAVATAPANSNDAAKQAQNIAQNQGPIVRPSEPTLNPVVTQRTEQANTQFGNDRLNDTRGEPITIPSCAPGAARPAAAGQC